MPAVLPGLFSRNFDDLHERKRSNLTQQFKEERKIQERKARQEIMNIEEPNNEPTNDPIVNNEGQHQTYHNPYHRTPTFGLYLWAALPILLIAFGGMATVILAFVATIINFFLIQIHTRPINRYILTGAISLVALFFYLAIRQF